MLICNPCRGRSSRILITSIIFLQLLFVLAVFLLLPIGINIQNGNINNVIESLSRSIHHTSTSESTSIDDLRRNNPRTRMVDDKWPYVDFKFKYPEIQPSLEGSKDFYLVVLVNSGAKGDGYRRRRAKIRATWGNKKTCEYANAMHNTKLRDLKWILVFVLGKTGGEEDQRNIEESRLHNDMIIGDIGDNYVNNILKFYMGQLWASLLGTKYTLKTDDDVYVRIPKVIEYLISEGSPMHFYGGRTYRGSEVMRYPGGKWSISKKYFPEKIFPPFNAGAFILFSTDLHGGLINYVHVRRPFHTDDAYIGVAMRDLKVKVVHILSFVIVNNMNVLINTKDDCYILKILAYGHSVTNGAMEHVHKRLEDLCQANTTLQTLKCPASLARI